MCVNRSIASNDSVFIEVLWYWQTQKDRETQYELITETIKIAELEKA